MFLRTRKLLSIALLSLAPILAHADQMPAKPDMNDMVRELQKLSQTSDGLRLVWWIPDEYWRATSPNPAAADQVTKALAPYVLLAVIDAKVSQFAAFTFLSESDMRAEIKIFDAAGNAYTPLDPKDISADAKNLLGFMRPIMANSMGDLGKNIGFVVFARKGLNGKPIVVTTEPGKFKVHFGSEDYNYRLPLASFSPKVKCANEPDLFPNYYKFCPFDGTPTVPQNP